MSVQKRIFVIAGPNGSGKSTFALALNPLFLKFYEFINADDIARALAPLHPESMALTASKLMIKRLKELLQANKNFAFETTGAGTNFVKYLESAKKQHYIINLIFLWLPNPDLAVKRVAQRVSQGGHFVSEEIVRRRYFLGLNNLFNYYLPLATHALILDNSNVEKANLIAEKKHNTLIVKNLSVWEEINRSIHVSR